MMKKGVLGLMVLAWSIFFTTISNGAVYFSDDIESGVVNDGPRYQDSVSGAGWAASAHVTVVDGSLSSVTPHSGSKMLRFRWDGSTAEGNFTLGAQQTGDVYIRFYVYYPNGTESGENAYVHRDGSSSDNNKLIRLWGQDYSNDAIKIGASSYYTSDSSVERIYMEAKVTGDHVLTCGGGMSSVYDDGVSLPNYYWQSEDLGRWISYEFHFKADSGAGNGAAEFWVDGVKVSGSTSLSFDGALCSPGFFLNGYLFGSANSSFASPTNIYIDDIVFADEYIGLIDGSGVTPPAQKPEIVQGFRTED